MTFLREKLHKFNVVFTSFFYIFYFEELKLVIQHENTATLRDFFRKKASEYVPVTSMSTHF